MHNMCIMLTDTDLYRWTVHLVEHFRRRSIQTLVIGPGKWRRQHLNYGNLDPRGLKGWPRLGYMILACSIQACSSRFGNCKATGWAMGWRIAKLTCKFQILITINFWNKFSLREVLKLDLHKLRIIFQWHVTFLHRWLVFAGLAANVFSFNSVLTIYIELGSGLPCEDFVVGWMYVLNPIQNLYLSLPIKCCRHELWAQFVFGIRCLIVNEYDQTV